MRQKQPLEVSDTWQYPLPMPMPNQPVCVTEVEALSQIERLGSNPQIFLWTDDKRRCPKNWQFLPSVRQGIPPQGIFAELNAWMTQYPKAWLVVDLRDGVLPPSVPQPIEDLLCSLGRYILVLVSQSEHHPDFPRWVLPE
jgi:hypothetical protein